MMKKRFYIVAFCLLQAFSVRAAGALRFMDVPLSVSADSLSRVVGALGFRPEGTRDFSARMAGLNVWLTFSADNDSLPVNFLLLTTVHQHGLTLENEYRKLMLWMRHHYGAPQWEGSVRGHAFARWFFSREHDIVMVATAKQTVEVWFYQNHSRRHFDYYAILKYCERHPAFDVPHMTAEESITWERTAPVAAKNNKVKRQRKVVRKRKHRRR